MPYRVSVVIPTYNRWEKLRRVLDGEATGALLVSVDVLRGLLATRLGPLRVELQHDGRLELTAAQHAPVRKPQHEGRAFDAQIFRRRSRSSGRRTRRLGIDSGHAFLGALAAGAQRHRGTKQGGRHRQTAPGSRLGVAPGAVRCAHYEPASSHGWTITVGSETATISPTAVAVPRLRMPLTTRPLVRKPFNDRPLGSTPFTTSPACAGMAAEAAPVALEPATATPATGTGCGPLSRTS